MPMTGADLLYNAITSINTLKILLLLSVPSIASRTNIDIILRTLWWKLWFTHSPNNSQGPCWCPSWYSGVDISGNYRSGVLYQLINHLGLSAKDQNDGDFTGSSCPAELKYRFLTAFPWFFFFPTKNALGLASFIKHVQHNLGLRFGLWLAGWLAQATWVAIDIYSPAMPIAMISKCCPECVVESYIMQYLGSRCVEELVVDLRFGLEHLQLHNAL